MANKAEEITPFITYIDEKGYEVSDAIINVVPYLDRLTFDDRAQVLSGNYGPIIALAITDGEVPPGYWLEPERNEAEAIEEYIHALDAEDDAANA